MIRLLLAWLVVTLIMAAVVAAVLGDEEDED